MHFPSTKAFLCKFAKGSESKRVLAARLRLSLSRLGGVYRRRKVKVEVMELWRKMIFPLRRVLARFKDRKNGAGLLKLHDDIQTCGYEDVQIMWEMLRRTETEVMPRHSKRKLQWFSRSSSSCSSHGAPVRSLSSTNQAH